MNFMMWAQNIKLVGDRFEYAGQALKNSHMGLFCPEDIVDEYCEKCLPKIIAVGERYQELPRFARFLIRICHPLKTRWALAEFEFCRGVWDAYQLGLSRGREGS